MLDGFLCSEWLEFYDRAWHIRLQASTCAERYVYSVLDNLTPVEGELRPTNCYNISFPNTSLTGRISWKLDIMNVEDWLADESLLAVMTAKCISQVNRAKEISPHYLRNCNRKMTNIAYKNGLVEQATDASCLLLTGFNGYQSLDSLIQLPRRSSLVLPPHRTLFELCSLCGVNYSSWCSIHQFIRLLTMSNKSNVTIVFPQWKVSQISPKSSQRQQKNFWYLTYLIGDLISTSN